MNDREARCEQAAKARREAEYQLRIQKQKTQEVMKVAKALREARETNHFADLILDALKGRAK